jgi:Carbohydrate binding domain
MSSQIPPRHLAPRRGPTARGRLLLAAGGAAVALAVGAVTIVLVGGGPAERDSGTLPGGSPFGTSPAATSPASGSPPDGSDTGDTTATTEATGTTAPPPWAIPGNLLANGDFEGGLGGWDRLGGAVVERVGTAHSGAWAVRVQAAEGGAGQPPGIAAPLQVEVRQGRTYQGSAWVRASRPGMEATLALREQTGDGRSSADVTGISLPDSQWHEVAVVHRVQLDGARLRLELTTGGDPGGGDLILVDQVGVTTR